MNDAKYYSLKSRIREEAQLLAEQKWIKEALVKIRAQRNALHIERMQLEAMRAAMIPTLPPDHYARVNEEKKKKAAAKAASKAAKIITNVPSTSKAATAEAPKAPERVTTDKAPAATDNVAAITSKAATVTDIAAPTTSKATDTIENAAATTSKAADTTDEAVATTSKAADTTDEAVATTSKAAEPFVEPDSPFAEFLKNEATCNSLPLDLGVPPMFSGGHAFRIEQFEEEEEEEDEEFENDEDLLLDMNMFMNCAQPPQE